MKLPLPKSIRWKVGLPILVIGIASGLAVGFYSYQNTVDQAKDTTKEKIKTAMTFTKASREYVRSILRPKIDEILASGCSKEDFILEAQSSSFFTASIFKKVSEEMSNFALRQVAFNPLNPKDEPNELETKIIVFMRNTGNKEYSDITNYRGERYFVYASAVVPDASCLRCHGQVQNMPKVIQTLYKPQRDPNWEVGKVQGAVMVFVPFESTILKAQLTGLYRGLFIFGLFLALTLFILFSLDRLVFKPVEKLERKAEEIAKGNVDEPVDIKSDDEIGKLAEAFERMRVSIKKVMDLLK
ncbi:MAG: c-type heme family protein [Hydrogenobacter sp.]